MSDIGDGIGRGIWHAVMSAGTMFVVLGAFVAVVTGVSIAVARKRRKPNDHEPPSTA